MKQWLKFAVTCLALTTGFAQAGSISLGQAANYNLFVKENFTATSSDTEGAVAIGGNMIINGGYDVGFVTGSDNAASLTVGGDIIKSGTGALNVYNGNYTIGAAPYGKPGNLVYGGTIQNNGGSINAAPSNSQKPAINFNNAFSQLEQLSSTLANMTSPITTNRNTQDRILTFKPAIASTSNVYVFELTQADLNNFHTIRIDNSNISKDALIVFNMTNKVGTVASEQSTAMTCPPSTPSCFTLRQNTYQIGNQTTDSNTKLAQNVLFNFNGINDLRISSSVYGSILAPKAAINAPTGVIWGQVIAKSWTGNEQVNFNPLNIPTGQPTVSAPPAWALMLLPLLLVIRRRYSNQPTLA